MHYVLHILSLTAQTQIELNPSWGLCVCSIFVFSVTVSAFMYTIVCASPAYKKSSQFFLNFIVLEFYFYVEEAMRPKPVYILKCAVWKYMSSICKSYIYRA